MLASQRLQASPRRRALAALSPGCLINSSKPLPLGPSASCRRTAFASVDPWSICTTKKRQCNYRWNDVFLALIPQKDEAGTSRHRKEGKHAIPRISGTSGSHGAPVLYFASSTSFLPAAKTGASTALLPARRCQPENFSIPFERFISAMFKNCTEFTFCQNWSEQTGGSFKGYFEEWNKSKYVHLPFQSR